MTEGSEVPDLADMVEWLEHYTHALRIKRDGTTTYKSQAIFLETQAHYFRYKNDLPPKKKKPPVSHYFAGEA